MVYRFQLSRNLKSLVVPGIAAVLTLAAVSVIVFFHVLVGILALAVTTYISYHMIKFFVNTLRSEVRTSHDGMVCRTAMGSESRIGWEELTHAGWYSTDSGYRELFVYAEEEDQLLTIPMQYERMHDLEREIVDHSGVELLSFTGEDVDGLTQELRNHVAPEHEVIDEDEQEPEATQD